MARRGLVAERASDEHYDANSLADPVPARDWQRGVPSWESCAANSRAAARQERLAVVGGLPGDGGGYPVEREDV